MARIAVIDDDPVVHVLVRSVLEADGHEVLSFLDALEALESCTSEGGIPDAIVLDLLMAGLSGWDLLGVFHTHRLTRNTPVLVLTGENDSENRIRALRGGAEDFLGKPFQPEELQVRIERLISRRLATQSELTGDLGASPASEVLQNLEMSGKSGELSLQSEGEDARVTIENGSIVFAKIGNLLGREAALAILELKSGRFSFCGGLPREPSGKGLALQSLLLEAAWLQDELGRFASGIPEAGVGIQLERRAVDWPKAMAELPFQTLVRALELEPGITLETLSSRLPFSPNKIRVMTAWLGSSGYLRFLPAKEGDSSQRGSSPAAVSAVVESEPLAPPGPKRLDGLLREVFQAALFRGLSLFDLKIDLYVHPFVMASVIELFSAFLLSQPEGRDRFSRACIEHSEGKLTFTIRSLEPPALRESEGGGEMAFMLWVKAIFPTRMLQALTQRLELLAGPSTDLLVVGGDDFDRARMVELFGRNSAWNVLAKTPESIEEILEILGAC